MTDSNAERIRALEEEVRRLTQMLESAPDFITRITVDGDFLYLNRLAPGFQMSDVLGTSADGYVPPEFLERAHAAMRAARETRTTQQYATLGRTSSERVGHYLTRVSPVIEDDEVTSLVMIATDVTALEESRTLLQLALTATGLGIWTMDETGTGSWDETTRRIFGTSSDACTNLADVLRKSVHEDDRLLVSDALAQAMQTGRYGPIEYRIVRSDEQVRWVTASGITVKDHQGNLAKIVGSVMDITHRRVLEARLLDAQKLESIGRLAGGVAHDFNNMLTVILGNVHYANEVNSIDEMRPLLAEIRLTAERSAALTAQLLAFARRQVIEPKIVDPNALLLRLESLLRRVLGAHINATFDLRTTGRVQVDTSQLEQVVLNLVTNARDSMTQGGSMMLTTSDAPLSENDASHHSDLAPGRYVLITVTDTGAGIAKTALPHVFEPFFTTRQGGTGLGLATCYGIVKQSGGHIAVTSEVSRGTTFSVYLPHIEATEPESRASVTPVSSAPAGERVLLVEDEPAVRSIIERTLERGSYRVVLAKTGEEALQLVETEGPFDLLITDVVMPGMSGWELGKRLAECCPKLRVLYVSGYTEEITKEDGALSALKPGVTFLQKPFLPDDLLAAVREFFEVRSEHDGSD